MKDVVFYNCVCNLASDLISHDEVRRKAPKLSQSDRDSVEILHAMAFPTVTPTINIDRWKYQKE